MTADVTTAECVRRLRAMLPPEAFAPNPRRLWMMAAHVLIVLGGYQWIVLAPDMAPIAALLIGHSLACLAFAGHEVSHNAVVRHAPAKYVITCVAFGVNAVSPTMWNRLHNDAHHRHAGTPQDPDRPFLTTERTRTRRLYHLVFYPSNEAAGNPLVWLHLPSYLLRNMLAVFSAGDATPHVVPAKVAYRRSERWCIALEIAGIVAIQWALWHALGRDPWRFAWASPAALAVSSAIVMTYVFTNHFLNPIAVEHDVLDGTTSVAVPRVVDRLHCHFSFHTEHHLFPTMNSDYYPLVSRALAGVAGTRYHRVPLVTAWRRLWRQDLFRPLDDRPQH